MTTKNQTQQKTIIKCLDTFLIVIWVGWTVAGGVSDIFFLNPSYYWIHEMIFKWWSDIGIVLMVVTIVVSILRGILIMFFRKRLMPKPERTQQELPKLKEGETMLDYFHRIQSIKNNQSSQNNDKN